MVVFRRPVRVTALRPGGARSVSSGSASPKQLREVVGNLEVLALALGETFNVSLPLPCLASLAGVKRFVTDLLDLSSRGSHPWWPIVRKLSLRTRLSISGSVFLFRKTLPSSAPSLDSYCELLSHPAPDPPSGFLSFVSEKVDKWFRPGWDRGYFKKVSTATLSTSASFCTPRSQGGARGNLFSPSPYFSKESYRAACCGDGTPEIDRRVRVSQVETEGKVRTVTVSTVDMSILKPLHDLLYDALSRMPWLLRGEAKPLCFAEFTRVEGEVFVSGDYESATDNLNLDVACHILERVLSTCTHVPLEVRLAALRSMRKELVLGSRVVDHKRGQLMGSLLCFPLLCLQNILAFKFLVRRRVPVKVNGDDIVFRATPSEYARWRDGVGRIGLKLSLGKTSVSSSWFSLNSTFFTVRRYKPPSLVPIVRSTQWFRKVEDPSAIRGRLVSFARGFNPLARKEWLVRLLKSLSSAIWSTQRSLLRGLGVHVPKDVLVRSGLWRREKFYLSLPSEPDLPLSRSEFSQNVKPEGWWRERVRSVTKLDDCLQRQFFDEMMELTWERRPIPPKEVSGRLWEECRLGTLDYLGYLKGRKKYARMLRLSFAKLDRSIHELSRPARVMLEKDSKMVAVWRPPWWDRARASFRC